MFFASLFCGQESQKPKVALQTYKQVPKEELQEYKFNKSRIRYDQGFKQSQSMLSTQMSFLRFKNNDPLEVMEDNQENLKNLMYQNEGKVIKKVVKSNYQQLVQKYKRNYQKYSDPDFKPCAESIGKTFSRKNSEWRRISEIIPKAEFVSDTISPEDILQGQLGNCYFLSAIAALAQNDFRIKNIFPKLQVNKNGFYMARIVHNGVLQQVVVDDYIPVDATKKPLFAKPSGGKQIWVMILEKCWAKLFGSYEAIVGGLPNQVLHAFSGAPTFYFSIGNNSDQQQQLFQQLMEANNEGAIMCCGSKSDPNIEKKGLVLGHAYTLIQVYDKPYRMLKVRNPWGEKQWNGRASEYDKEFWKRISPYDRDRLGHTQKNDGIFFMLWEDFVQYFSMLDICRINDNANYFPIQNMYKDDEPKMYEFETSGGQVVVTISQKNTRGLDWRQKKKGYGTATLVVAKQVKQGSSVDYQYVASDSDHSFADFSLVLKDLQKGKYVIYSSMKWTRSQQDLATISVYTESRVTLGESKVNPNDFLYKTFLDHARKNQENIQVMNERPYEWACSDLLSEKCGFGYLAFHIDKTSKRKIGLEINERDYTNIKLELMSPYKGKGVFKLTAQPGKELIVMFRIKPGFYAGSFTLPMPKMFVLY